MFARVKHALVMLAFAHLALVGAACSGSGAPTDAPYDADLPDARQFCLDRESYTCAHECPSGRYDATRCMTDCTSTAIVSRCGAFRWAPGCSPTRATTSACIDALRDATRMDVPAGTLPECQTATICGS